MERLPQTLPTPYRVPEAGPYWDGANNGILRLQYCQDCQTPRFYPRHLCAICGSSSVTWRDVSGLGVVYSFTIVHRGPSAAFKARQPYVVALIDLQEGPRMMSNIVGDDARQVAIGDAVKVQFERRGEMALPVFERLR